MKFSDIVEVLGAHVVCGESNLFKEVEYAFASDLMSDVLTVEKTKFLLITGLTNPQTIRTAEISDTPCIVFVRNKKITDEMLELAKQTDMVLMEYKGSLFKAAGLLYSAGLKPVY